MALPFAGGRVPGAHGQYPAYANGKEAYRCSACGLVNPWGPTWTAYTSILEMEESGLLATYRAGGYPVACSPKCQQVVMAHVNNAPLVERKPRSRR